MAFNDKHPGLATKTLIRFDSIKAFFNLGLALGEASSCLGDEGRTQNIANSCWVELFEVIESTNLE